MTNPADTWLQQNAGASYPAVAFERVGYMLKGRVAELPRVVSTPSLNGQGDDESYVVALDVAEGSQVLAGKSGERQPAVVGQRVSVWIRKGQMANALAAAISKVNVSGLAVGGMLAIRRDADGQGKPGMTAPHMFTVQYAPPAPVVDLPFTAGPFDNGTAAPSTPDMFATQATPDPFAGQAPANAGDLF